MNPVDGDVWMATSCGLARYGDAKGTWTYYTRAEGLPSDQANGIAFGKDGTIYVGTQCDGIAIASPKDDYKTWRRVRGPEALPTTASGSGLPTNLINDVLVARDGTVYAATTAGLAWSGDEGERWRYVRGADWADKVRESEKGPPAGWSATGGAVLAEDYCTALAEDSAGGINVGHRSTADDVVMPGVARIVTEGTAEYVEAIVCLPGGARMVGSYGDGVALLQRGMQLSATMRSQGNAPLPASAAAPTTETLHEIAKAIATRAASPRSALYEGEDWTTEGDWVGRYGRQYAVLCAADWPLDATIAHGNMYYDVTPRYRTQMPKADTMRAWQLWPETADKRVLYDPQVGHRRHAEWDDHGEAYDKSQDGPDVVMDIRVDAGINEISFYFLNANGHSGENRFRDFEIVLASSGGIPLVKARVTSFWGGVYKQFQVKGPATYHITIKRNHSLNTICSAVLIDRIAGTWNSWDQLPLPWSGGTRYGQPYINPADWQPLNDHIAAAAEVWEAVRTRRLNPKTLTVDRGDQLFALRAVASAHPSRSVQANWRWAVRLWNAKDREEFTQSMTKSWTQMQSMQSAF